MPSLPRTLCRLLGALAAALLATVCTVAADAPRDFDVPSGPAAETLKRFAAQAAHEIVFASDKVERVTTNAVRGRYTAPEAIAVLLANTGLRATLDAASRSFAVREESPAPNAPRAATATARAAESVVAASAAGDVVELSPFTVNAAADRGYQAQSSLSGSRLKTDLKDMAAPVSAFTEQFLLDTATTNTDDLARFMLSTEFDFGEDAGGQNRLFGTARPLRMRGLAGGEVTTNFFKTGGRADAFSLKRIEQARGPNAILFGVGNPGGIINSTTKRARLNASSGAISGRIRSHEGTRIEGDYNQVVVPNTLAVRIAAVKTNLNSWRNHQFNDEDRYFGTLRWRPTTKTDLTFEAEKGHQDKRSNRTFTALDAYTPWLAAGRPLSATANAALAAERHSGVGTNWIVLTENDGTLLDRSAQTRTTARNQVGGDPTLNDFRVLPRETSILGPGMGQSEDYVRLSAFLTHAFTPALNVELAAMRQDIHFVNVDAQQNLSQYLRADPSPTLPTGATNPNAGRAYLESQTQRVNRDARLDAVRLSGSYRFDLGRIFGAHTLAAVGEYNFEEQLALQNREFVVSSNAPSTTLAAAANRLPENNNNRIWRRTYVDLNGPSDGIVMLDWRKRSSSGLVDPVTGRTYATDWIPFGATAVPFTSTETKTAIGMLQSAFWKNRIHTVVGLSRDERSSLSGSYTRLAPTPGFTGGVLTPIRGTVPTEGGVTNKSFSGVFHATPWLGLTYSRAANSGLANNSGSIPSADGTLPNQLPPRAEGNSEEVGLKLDLFGRRVFIAAQYFQTSADNDFDFTSVVSQANVNLIWDALAANGVADPITGRPITATRDVITGSTFSSKTQGYEVELTANPTKDWRLFLNYTRTRTVRSNIAPEMVAYIAAQRGFWTQGDRARMYLVGRGVGLASAARDGNATVDTITEQLDLIDNNLLNGVVLANGRRPLGQIPQRLNFRTTYDLDEGVLKGVSLGLGARLFDRPIIGFIAATATTPPVIRHGDRQAFVDANISYRRKFRAFGRSVGWSVQLNVDNVLNNDRYLVLRQNNLGEVLNYKFNDPREWILTNRFTF